MSKSWYKKIMPTIKEASKELPNIAKTVGDIDGINGVYVWGEYLKHKGEPAYPLRGIDIIAETDIHSEDLLSVTEDDNFHPLSMSKEALEDEGYNPDAVNLTKSLMKVKSFNIERWAISKDGKLLHLGPVTSSEDEWNDMKTDAEDSAGRYAGMDTSEIKDASKKQQESWYTSYKRHFDNCLQGMPQGWYETNQSVDDVVSKSEKLI